MNNYEFKKIELKNIKKGNFDNCIAYNFEEKNSKDFNEVYAEYMKWWEGENYVDNDIYKFLGEINNKYTNNKIIYWYININYTNEWFVL